MVWVKEQNYKANWKLDGNRIGGGGQGEAWKVINKHDGNPAFLKIIKAKKDPERRARFFREASIYSSMESDGIPKLIESNTQEHRDLKTTPYIVTEYIKGNTLDKWRENTSSVNLDVAVALTDSLAKIVAQCHSADVVHRDIKPQNIILRDDNPFNPILLDFGLNYHELPDLKFSTLDSQEVGNRFLRLPELSAGSLNKKDPRSDISFTAGIFFYVLTGCHPDQLLDDKGRMPHQRSELFNLIKIPEDAIARKLLSFFDHCFAYEIEDRYKNIDVFITRLNQILEPEKQAMSSSDDFDEIERLLNLPEDKRRVDYLNLMKLGLLKVSDVFIEINKNLKGALKYTNIGYIEEAEACTSRYSWTKAGSRKGFSLAIIKTTVKGSELLISISGKEIHRTPITKPDWGNDFEEAVKRAVLPSIKEALMYPELHIPELEFFQENKPFIRLKDAEYEAKKSGREILAFVYDPTLPEREGIHWSLIYFLEYAKTRDMMNNYFITALITIKDFSSYSNALDQCSMKNGRYVLIDKNMNAKYQDGIVGNADEGGKAIRNLILIFKENNDSIS
jgi:serine/threonine-protein kinase